MVQVSTPQLKESRHVAIKGLPITTTNETIHNFFARFGPIQRITRQDSSIVFISFDDTRAAAAALQTDHIERGAPFKIAYYNPEMPFRANLVFPHATSVPSTPSSNRSSSPQQPMSPAYRSSSKVRDENEMASSPHHRQSSEQSTSFKRSDLKLRLPTVKPYPRDFWDPPNFNNLPGNVHDKLLLIIVFEVKHKETMSDKHVFEAVKSFVKKNGVVFHIDLEQTTDARYKKAKVFYSRLDMEKLRKERGPLLDGPIKFRVYHPPCQIKEEPSMDMPSTSRCTSIETAPTRFRYHSSYTSVHVLNPHHVRPDEYFKERFSIYGDVIDVGRSGPNEEGKEFSVVQFASFHEAESALRDPQLPKPLVAPSMNANRLIMFNILTAGYKRDDILTSLRECAPKAIEINVDWIQNRAVLGFENFEATHEVFKRLKAKKSLNFKERVVPIDYCSEKLNDYFVRAKRRVLDMHKEARSRNARNGRRRRKKKKVFNENGDAISSSSCDSDSENDENGFGDYDYLGTYELDYVNSERKKVPPYCHQGSQREHSMEPSTSTQTTRKMSTSSNAGCSSSADVDDEYNEEWKREVLLELPDNALGRMIDSFKWKPFDISAIYPRRVDDISNRNRQARAAYEKATGRPMPKFSKEDTLRTTSSYNMADNHLEVPAGEVEVKMREWKRISEMSELDDWKTDGKDLLRVDGVSMPTISSGGRSGRPSLDETRAHRISFDANHHMPHHEHIQRSQSISVGPMTPMTPFHAMQHPLLVNTSQPSTSTAGGINTPRSSIPQLLPSPVSRHGSMSSTGRPASIQGLRHHSVIFPPDISIPPPPIPPTQDEMVSGTPPSRRSSETLAPLKSPPLGKIQQLMSMPLAPPPGMGSGSSSTTSTPRHSISAGTPHFEPTTPKSVSYQNLNSSVPGKPQQQQRPEKIQVRHDSISKPGPSTAASALQSRSQSMSVGKPPVVRDAGTDLIEQIMSNQPSMGFKKLPRIEKKPSALLHLQQNQTSTPSTPSTPSTSSMLLKDKEREKERRRREKEAEREREARKEMKRKETKEERHKRKEMERAKREEDERRERKREKQRLREKEERKREKEKEKERRRAEKERMKRKAAKKDSSSDENSADEDTKKKELTQEEKDHQLALILSQGSIFENLKSRRKAKRSSDSFEKLRQKNQDPVGLKRRVLIESSDSGEDDDEEKGSGTEEAALSPAPLPPSLLKEKHKEREKGELSSSEDDENQHRHHHQHQDSEHKTSSSSAKENRKRQKSLSTFSEDDHAGVKRKRQDSEELLRKKTWDKEERKSQKRKLEARKSSEDEKNKAKRDFRDVPLEDVSDEEEVENPENRKRRQSASSTSSKPKTPLRVKTPSGTPLMSPKILSPKILSPKISSSGASAPVPEKVPVSIPGAPGAPTNNHKRPSLTDPEPLTSPRMRTTSSTSTTSSRNEPVPEKPASPPVTAKSSVSSMGEGDLQRLREEFPNSPRPMVLTKAAMKTYHSSPPKKLRTTPESSSDEDSSSGGSSSSSDSSDEEEPPKPADVKVEATPVPPPALPAPPVTEQVVEKSPVREPEPDPEPEKEPEAIEEVTEKPPTPVPQSSEFSAPEIPAPASVPMPAPEPAVPEVEPEKIETPPPPPPPPTPKFQSLISDQEQNSAVQSIFDDDEDVDVPQYPDHYTIAKERKSSEDEPAVVTNGPYQNGPLVLEDDIEVAGEQEIVIENPEEPVQDDDEVVEITPPAQPPTQPPVLPAPSLPVQSQPPVQEQPAAQPTARAPTPELIEASAPIQKCQPLEVSVSQNSSRQVIQPSPRPAAPANLAEAAAVQPPKPSPSTSQNLAIMLANFDPQMRSKMKDEVLQVLLQGNQLPPELAQQVANGWAQHQKMHSQHNVEKKKQVAEMERLERDKAAKKGDDAPVYPQATNLLSSDAMAILKEIQTNGARINGLPQRPSTSSAPAVPSPVVSHLPPPSTSNTLSIDLLQQRRTWFYGNFPSMWSGGLGIKSNAVRVKLHLVNGSQEFLMSTLGRGGSLQREAVKITQRLRLDNGQVEHLHGILTEPQFACCLAFVESSTPEEHATYESVLQTSFIDYLKAKSIAGTSSLPPTDVLAEARAHIFPPGELVDKYVAELAPALYNYLFEQNTKYLFVVFTDDKVKPNMNTAPPALTVDPLPC